MKKLFSKENGVTMLTLSMMIIVMAIIMSVIFFYVNNSVSTENFQKMKADISEIESKALTYYLDKGVLPVYSYGDDCKRTQIQILGDRNLFNVNDGEEYAKVNLNLIGVVPAYDTAYYINTESFTVYADKPVKIKSKLYSRVAEEFDKLNVEINSIPEWEKECYDTEIISKMFRYSDNGYIIGIDEEYCKKNSNPEYYSNYSNWHKLVIPTNDGKGNPVIGIQQCAFENIDITGTLKIPRTITYVPQDMFGKDSTMKVLYCDASGIDVDAFSRCNSIQEVYIGPSCIIPSATTVAESETQNGFLCGKGNLNKIWIETTTLGTYAFANCNNLELIILNNNTKVIPDYCFFGCVNGKIITLTSNTITGENWPTYEENKHKMPEKLEKIGKYAFYGCKNMKGEINFANCSNLTSIGNYAFYDTQLTKVTINGSITYNVNNSFPASATITKNN